MFGKFEIEYIAPPPLFQTSVAAYLAKLREVTALRVQMVMVVVSNKNDAVLYQTIKTHTKCECPTISQVVTLTVLRKPKGEGFQMLSQLICLCFYFPFLKKGEFKLENFLSQLCFPFYSLVSWRSGLVPEV